MKFREDFVTISSSSSYICCFARIADPEKAQVVLDRFPTEIDTYTAHELLEMTSSYRRNPFECDWAGVDMTPGKKYLEDHASDIFVVATDRNDLECDEDGYCEYDVSYEEAANPAIDAITKENGFADTECQWGAGRDG